MSAARPLSSIASTMLPSLRTIMVSGRPSWLRSSVKLSPSFKARARDHHGLSRNVRRPSAVMLVSCMYQASGWAAAAATKTSESKALNMRRRRSKDVFEPDLDDSRATTALDPPGVRVGQSSVAGVGDGGVRVAQVEVIERIQSVATNLNEMRFGDAERFLHADIIIPESRAEKHVPGRIPVLPRLRRSECRRVKPLHALYDVMAGLLARVEIGARDRIRTSAPPADDVRGHSECQAERGAGLIPGDARYRPAACDAVQNAIVNVKTPVFPERKFVQVVHDQNVAGHRIGVPVIGVLIVRILHAPDQRHVVQAAREGILG